MKPYLKLATDTTPEVRFDPSESLWQLRGQSFPADVSAFYEPLLLWIDALRESGAKPNAVVRTEISYINSSSEKYLHYLFYKFGEMNREGAHLRVEWFYDEEDEVIEGLGREYSNVLEVPIKMIELEHA